MGTQFVSPRSICDTVEGAIATEIVSKWTEEELSAHESLREFPWLFF